MSCIGFVAVFLLVSCSCLEALKSVIWREVFTVDIVAPGFSLSLHAGNELDCARHCLHQDDCKTSAFHRHSATCWLYPHLLYYTTTGMASPGTRYFWRLSASCPAELGYQLDSGICLKVYLPWVNWTVAEETCRKDAGHLLIADTAEKRQALLRRSSTTFWLGASDKDKERDWRWVDGSVVKVWCSPYKPSNSWGLEHFLQMNGAGVYNDVTSSATRAVACQVPLL